MANEVAIGEPAGPPHGRLTGLAGVWCPRRCGPGGRPACIILGRGAGRPPGRPPRRGHRPRPFPAEVEQGFPSESMRRWRPEPYPRPASVFGLVECPEPATIRPDPMDRVAWERWGGTTWPPRTRASTRDSDGTRWPGGTGP